MSERDPIGELADSLRRGKAPSLAWVIRWSEGGRDPVTAAWEASEDGYSMLVLTWIHGRGLANFDVEIIEPRRPTRAHAYCVVLEVDPYQLPTWAGPCQVRLSGVTGRALAHALRGMLPPPPTLPQLLAAIGRGEGSVT